MNKKQLLEKLDGIEWTDFECKESKRSLPRDIWKTVSAFSNTEGGYIVLGVKQDGNKFKITGVDNPDKIQNDFVSTLRGEKFNIELATTGYMYKTSQGIVLVFKIEQMPRQAKPIYYNNEMRNTFIRFSGSTQKASKDEVARMVREASEKSSDSMVLDGFGIDDLDQNSIKTFHRFLEARHPGHHLLSCSIPELLERLQAVVKTGKKEWTLTSAGLLLFGKSVRILNQFPSYFMDYLDKRGIDKKDLVSKRWVDRYSSEENVINTFVEFNRRLRNIVAEPFVMEPDGMNRNDDNIARKAMREALVNLLIHMDYFDRKGSRITVYDDRVELYNPGCLRFAKNRLFKEHITEPRNPSLAKLFRLLHWAERSGEGMFTIRDGWSDFGYHVPQIKDDKELNYFQLTMPLTRKKALSRVQKGTKLQPKSDQVTKKVTKSDKKKGPSWHQVGTKLGLSSNDIKTLLKFCITAKSLTEIMQKLQRKDRTYFRNHYVKPFIKKGLLQLTIPDKPNSPCQKYVIAETVKSSLFSKSKTKKGTKLSPSRDKVLTKLGLSTKNIKIILKFCVEEKYISEIMKKMRARNRTKFRNKYINPLLRDAFLQMTIPKKPNSPNQKYITTDKGKKLLKG